MATIQRVEVISGLGLRSLPSRTGQHREEPSNAITHASVSGAMRIVLRGCRAVVTALRVVSQIRARLMWDPARLPTAKAASQDIAVFGHASAAQLPTGVWRAGGKTMRDAPGSVVRIPAISTPL